MADVRERTYHLTCRSCGRHCEYHARIGSGQFYTCKWCGIRQPGLPALWWAWDRLEQRRAVHRNTNKEAYARRLAREAEAASGS